MYGVLFSYMKTINIKPNVGIYRPYTDPMGIVDPEQNPKIITTAIMLKS